MLHGEQVRQRKPYLPAEKLSKRLRWITHVLLVSQQVFGEPGVQFGIAANFDMLIVEPDRTEIFGETFVEPSLHGRIVVIQQQVREVVSHRAPGFFFEQVQNDEVLVIAGQEKPGHADWLTLMQRRTLVVRLVVLEGENGQRHRLVEPIFHQQRGKDRTHLLEAKRNFFAFFLAGIGNDSEVRGVNLEPR